MIQILKYQTAETAQSPESLDLLSGVEEQARRVFDAAETTTWRPGMGEPKVRPGAYVLLVGPADILVTAQSLDRMKRAIDGGAHIAVPSRVADFPRLTPLYTLRAYERLERRLLDEGHQPGGPPSSQMPLCLLARAAFDRAIQRMPVSRLLTDSLSPTELAPSEGIARIGIFHAFIDYYGEVRADLLPYLPPNAADVLEIGCGRGKTGALIQEKLGCRVTGVEMNPEVAAEAAGRLWRVIVGDISTTSVDGRYDAVVASELFEHLAFPRELLMRARALLRPRGRIVLSVPNVGHYSVVEDLLAGRWDYLPIGLLCYTHLRFFTRATLEDWIGRAGFRTWEIVPQKTDVPERFSRLSGELEVDRESLGTKGFYVVLHDPN